MDISYLKEFLVVVEEGRLGEAAERLYTTSSSLSKHINALEEEYGVKLFDRTKRTISLNEYGKIFLPYARQIIQLNEDVIEHLEEKKADLENVLNIGAGYRTFEVAVEFRRKYHIGLNINEGYDLKGMLRSGECELAIMVNEENKKGELEVLPYKKDHMVLVCHKKHPLAERKSVDISELREEDFIMLPDSDKNRPSKILLNACLEAGFTPKVVLRGVVGSQIVDFVAQNMGVSLLWEKALVPIMREETTTVDVVPATDIDISICYMKNRILSDAAKQFIEFARNNPDL